IRFLELMTVTILSSHRETVPYGLDGGMPGKRGVNSVLHANGDTTILGGNDEITLSPGDVFIIRTPGGGGFGKKTIPAT
ncbi:MAG: hydantoinase B/oxoprolinase family protein, partial [Desulforhopalus sp.]